MNDAIIGNSTVLASLNKKGELLRFFAPNIDYMNHVEVHKVAIVLDNRVLWLDNDSIFSYDQYYTPNTNILNTRIYNDEISILQIDYIDINNNVLVRKYIVERIKEGINKIDLVIYSKLNSSKERMISSWYNEEYNSLIQYTKDSYVVTFSNNKIENYQINNSNQIFNNLYFNQKDYIGMSSDSVIKYTFDESNTLKIYIGYRDSIYMAKKMIDLILTFDEDLMYQDTKRYWENIINKCKKYKFKSKEEEQIYIRSILTLLMYTNDKTGAIIAACEVDEGLTKCGRYGYVWPRDSAFITKAFNIVGLDVVSELFYKVFCKLTQFEDGRWEQRYYTDGNIAPCWGMQIDEMSCVVIGMIEQYLINKDQSYIVSVLPNIEKAIEFLLKSLDDNNFTVQCYDLWEMHEGKNLYTLASIYKAFAMYAQNLPDANLVSLVKTKMEKIKENILNGFWTENMQCFKRNLEDDILDISIISIVWPFDVLGSLNDKVIKTVEKIEERLKDHIGGIHRFEYDHYMNDNPWIICTLWLSMYYIKKYKKTFDINDYDKAREYFDFATNHQSMHGFLAEQISKEDSKPLWVNGLAWSHAMYIICLEEFYG